MDVQVVRFLRARKSDGVKIVNWPQHIREWMVRERKDLTARRNRKVRNIDGRSTVFSALLGIALLFQACSKSLPSTNREHIRGAIQNLDGQVLTVATSTGSVRVRLEPSTRVATVVQSDRAHISGGSFLGIPPSRNPTVRGELSKSIFSTKRCAGLVKAVMAGIGQVLHGTSR